jgi:hypothetical protein
MCSEFIKLNFVKKVTVFYELNIQLEDMFPNNQKIRSLYFYFLKSAGTHWIIMYMIKMYRKMLTEICPVSSNGKINIFLALPSISLSLYDSSTVILIARFQTSKFTFI